LALPLSSGSQHIRPAMYLLYSLLLSAGIVVAAPFYLWRHRGRLSALGLRERFGFLPHSFQQPSAGAIWVHSVSVGETLAAVRLVQQLQQVYPDRKVFLSHVTAAGRQAGEHRLPDVAGRFYLPLDWCWSVRRAFRRLRPSLLLLVETELWPNLLRMAKQHGACVMLVNGRLSDRSFGRYRLIRPFLRRVLSDIDCICARMAADAARFVLLGAPPGRVVITGNLKFDARPPEVGELPERLRAALQQVGRSPVMVAGSTMPSEEKLVLQAWGQIQQSHPKGLLILAPRHPARFGEVAQLLSTEARRFVRRTSLGSDPATLAGQMAFAEVLLLDTIGELAGLFELADVVFMGGSLVPTGGHNLLEPAYWGKPILFGPHMQNFPDVASAFLQSDAAIQVGDWRELAVEVLRLLEDGTRRQQLGKRAREVLAREAGATERVIERVRQLIGS